MLSEPEKQEQFMLLMLQLATRREREVIKNNRQLFLRTMRDLRRLVQRMSPDGEFRSYEWRRLQSEAPRMINNFVTGLAETLMPELVALEAPVQELAQDYIDIEETSFVPQTEQQVLESVYIDRSKLPLLAYLVYNGRLANDLVNRFNRAVDIGLLRGDPTPKIADDIVKLTVRAGQVVPVMNTGSYAKIASTQVDNTIDGAVWGQINQNLKVAWRGTEPKYWVWNAVLDSQTCPVCAPLHLKIVPKPPTFVSTGFSRTLPPVHPRCRSSILPVLN